MKIKNLGKKFKREIIYASRHGKDLINLNKNFFKRARGSRIIVYHGICLKDHTKFNGIFLRRDTFEQHIRFYKEYFHIVSLDDFYKKNLNENKFNICITFDDGYYNNFKYVLPLMEKHKIPICFFITTIRDAGYDILWNDLLGIATKYGPDKIRFNNQEFLKLRNQYTYIKTKERLPDILRRSNFTAKEEMMKTFSELIPFPNKKEDEDFSRLMKIEDIKQLSSSLNATIGSHGYYHNDLSEIPIDDCKKELVDSKLFLETICGKKIDSLAFPYGHYTREVVDAAKSTGYDKLLALDFHFEGDKNDPSMRERMIMNPYVSITNQMYAIVKGSYE